MRLSHTPQTLVWDDFPASKADGPPASLTYRPAESLDVEIASAAAATYGKKLLLADQDLRADFGFTDPDQAELLDTLVSCEDDFKAYANHFYAVALAERLISKFEGFTCADTAKPLLKSRAAFALLFRDHGLQTRWLQKANAKVHAQASAGNG